MLDLDLRDKSRLILNLISFFEKSEIQNVFAIINLCMQGDITVWRATSTYKENIGD